MRRQIFRSMTLLALVGVLLSCFAVMGVLVSRFYNQLRSELQRDIVYVAAAVEAGGESYLAHMGRGEWRITFIDTDGTVLYDSHENAATMDNHHNRPEVQAAFEVGRGEDRRLSQTLLVQTCYYALRLEDGRVLRLAGDTQSVYGAVWDCAPYIGGVAVMVAVFAGMLAGRETRRIVTPLETLNLEHPLENDTYEELSVLLRRIDHQNSQLESRLEELHRTRDEFAAITDNMREGIIVIGEEGMVLAINGAAAAMIGTDKQKAEGRHILSVYRDLDLVTLLERCGAGQSGEKVITRAGRKYQLLASPARGYGARGAVFLLLDVTERHAAEAMRREFSANVSHELKTPLTAILGYAELIENGMAKPVDIRRFAGVIRAETERLITLVGNIIRLSRLDEEAGLSAEAVDLTELSQRVAGRLEGLAGAQGLTLTVNGEQAAVMGVSSLIEEMIENLLDNAIKYNRPGGRVDVSVTTEGEKAILRVSDTGIGIPEEHLGRVFERFYRVDKSHAKDTGGTGLGLAIVKNGAAYHKAQIKIDSTVGKGTDIRLIFDLYRP